MVGLSIQFSPRQKEAWQISDQETVFLLTLASLDAEASQKDRGSPHP